MFCIHLRTNSDLCHLHHKLIGFYNRYEKCLQRGTDWVFKYSGLRFVFKGLNLYFIARIIVGSQICFAGKYRLQVQSKCHYIYIRWVYKDIVVILDRFLGIISQGLSALLLLTLARYILTIVTNTDTHQPDQLPATIFSPLVIMQNRKVRLSLSTSWRHIGGVDL